MKVNSAKLVLCLLSLIGISVIPRIFSEEPKHKDCGCNAENFCLPRESASAGSSAAARNSVQIQALDILSTMGPFMETNTSEISLTSSQLDDVLKSLTALDLTGGRISGATYNSQEPTAHQVAGAFRWQWQDRGTLGSLLQELRGARIEVRNGSTSFSGRLHSAWKRKRGAKITWRSKRRRSPLMNDSGDVRQFPAIGAGKRPCDLPITNSNRNCRERWG